MSNPKCGYPHCLNKVEVMSWNHQKYGYMCQKHMEIVSTHECMERAFNMTVDELKKGIAHYESIIQELKLDTKHQIRHMKPYWEKGLKIYRSVLEVKEVGS